MARAVGVGGIFFKARDAETLRAWYRDCLGVPVDGANGAMFSAADMPREAVTVWSVFEGDTTYFAPSTSAFMVNFVVDGLEGALAQVSAAGGTVVGDIENYDYGRVGWFLDPEGNKVELWELPRSPEG